MSSTNARVKEETVFRTNFVRTLIVGGVLAAVAAGGAFASAAAVTLGPAAVPVNPNGYRFAVNVTCPPNAESAPCTGALSMQTVPIRPYAGSVYSNIPKKKWPVGYLEFSVPAGKTVPVRGRLLAGALVQVKTKGSVKVLADVLEDDTVVAKRTLTLKLRRG
jgi:hypothetical protein